jgi:hypothetical protein
MMHSFVTHQSTVVNVPLMMALMRMFYVQGPEAYRWQKLVSLSNPLYAGHRAFAESLNDKLLAADGAKASAT